LLCDLQQPEYLHVLLDHVPITGLAVAVCGLAIALLSRSRRAIGSVLARSFVAIALLACNSNAASLQPSETRQDPLDLQVFTLDSQGNRTKTVYYSYDQLLTLPTVIVKPNVIQTQTHRIPSPKSEQLRRARIPTTSLLTFLQRNRQPPRFSDDL
jgi:hypothetical protein